MQLAILLAQDGESSGGSSLLSFIPFVVVGLVVYLLMFRPQRKRMKEQASLQASIGVGDEVITNSGIYGFITGEDGDKFWLEIDDDVQIRIARAAVQGKAPQESDESDDDQPSTDDDAAIEDGESDDQESDES